MGLEIPTSEENVSSEPAFSVSVLKTEEEIQAHSAVCLPTEGYLQRLTGSDSKCTIGKQEMSWRVVCFTFCRNFRKWLIPKSLYEMFSSIE